MHNSAFLGAVFKLAYGFWLSEEAELWCCTWVRFRLNAEFYDCTLNWLCNWSNIS